MCERGARGELNFELRTSNFERTHVLLQCVAIKRSHTRGTPTPRRASRVLTYRTPLPHARRARRAPVRRARCHGGGPRAAAWPHAPGAAQRRRHGPFHQPLHKDRITPPLAPGPLPLNIIAAVRADTPRGGGRSEITPSWPYARSMARAGWGPHGKRNRSRSRGLADSRTCALCGVLAAHAGQRAPGVGRARRVDAAG